MPACDSCGSAVGKGEHCSNCGTLSLYFSSIGEYLSYIDLPQYEKSMSDNHITFEMLSDLKDTDLQLIGISSLGHRKKILNSCKPVSSGLDDPDDFGELDIWSWRGKKLPVFLLGVFVNFIGLIVAISVTAIRSPVLMLVGAVIVLIGLIIGVMNRGYALVLWAAMDVALIIQFFFDTSFLR